MKNKVIAFILIFTLMFSVLIPKKINATVVVGEVVIEVGTVLYYIIQGVITGVEVKTIVETISTSTDRYTAYKKSDGSSNTLYKFYNSDKYRIKPSVAQSLVDNLTDKQLVEIANNVSITEDGTINTGDISDNTKRSVNGIMIDISRSSSYYDSTYSQLVTKRKTLSDVQLKNIREIIEGFSYDNTDLYTGNEYKYPYFAIIPTLTQNGKMYYQIWFSMSPLILISRGIDNVDIYPIDRALTGFTDNGSSVTTVRQLYSNTYQYIYTYKTSGMFTLQFPNVFKPDGTGFPINEFMRNDISIIGHGIIQIDEATYNSIRAVKDGYSYDDMSELFDKVYEIPFSLADVNTDYTYIEKEKTEIVVKDGATTVKGNLNEVVEQIQDYENSDKENHMTWDNTQSAINKNMIVGVIDNDYIGGIDVPDTPVDLTGVNKRLDEVIEKLGAIVGSIGDINALTDEQLKEILKDLDLTNTNGLTIEQVREYAEERELTQEKELENELDLKKYEVDSGIINKFPFCIPFDLVKVIKKMDSTSTAPRFEFPFKFERLGINETIVLDLSQFEKVAVIVRWFVLISYLLLLIYATRSLIKG